MPDIRYIALSDMHLGAENSLLTNLKTGSFDTDPSKPSPVLIKLVECLKQIISKNESTVKPKLILNGDLIELALTTTNDAAMSFQRFIELTMPVNEEWMFDNEIIFIPGNHDHQLWEFARKAAYVNSLRQLKPGDTIHSASHITKLFEPEIVKSEFLTALIQVYPHLKNVQVNVSYPGYGVLNKINNRCIIFNHGLYVESMYTLMTTLRSMIFPDRMPPLQMKELEEENFAWVDFFWSELGRSGSVGKDINLIYDKLQDKAQVNKMITNIATSISSKKKNLIIRWLEKTGLKAILHLTIGRLAASERGEPEVDLTPDAEAGLKQLLERQILNQLSAERNGRAPADYTFIFGHTHKPFQREIEYRGYPGKVKIFNSGGWVVDTTQPQPLHGGSVILVDEHFDTLTLQMYKEGKYRITLEDASGSDSLNKNDLYQRISKQMNFNAEPWTGFEKTVEEQVSIRYEKLKEIIKSNSL